MSDAGPRFRPSARWRWPGLLLACALLAGAAWGGWVLLQPRPIARRSFDDLLQAANRHVEDPEVYRELGYRCLARGQRAEALRWVREAQRWDPYNAENANIEGMVEAEQGHYDKAVHSFRSAIQLNPKAVEPHVNLGRLALQRGSLWLASTEFETAIGLAPKDPEPHYLLGLALKERGYAVNAKSSIRKALELDPNEPGAHSALGQVYADFGQPLEARKELQRAIDLGDDTPRTRTYLGLAYAILPAAPTDADTAIQHLRHAEGVGERSAQLYYGLGLAYLAKKDYAQGEKAFLQGLEVAPGSEGMRYGLARIYLATGRAALGQKTLRLYSELIRSRQLRESLKTRVDGQPERVELRVKYADLLMTQGLYDEAGGEYVKCLKLKPDDGDLYRKLQEATRLGGQPVEGNGGGGPAEPKKGGRQDGAR